MGIFVNKFRAKLVDCDDAKNRKTKNYFVKNVQLLRRKTYCFVETIELSNVQGQGYPQRMRLWKSRSEKGRVKLCA